MESLGKIIYEGFDQAKVRRTVMEAATALFEGLTPQQKARRTIRQLLPPPPNGWDAIAVDEQGNPLLTADNHNQMSIINCLEYHIRSIFFHDGRSNPKFEPGIARIAYTEIGVWPEGLPDWRPNHPEHRTNGIRPIVNVLREISGVHSDDYDFDLNGMSGDELIARFAHGSTGQKYVNEEADGSGTNYKVVWIPNFETAKKYGHYTKNTQQWCLTKMRRYWNNYTKGNTVKMYFLIAQNVDEVEPEPGPDAPLDAYGLSLIGVGIAPDGTLDNCCTRWNHMHGGTDMSLNEEQLCKLLNVRELSDICPPYTEEDRTDSSAYIEEILKFAKENADDTRAVKTHWEMGDYALLGVQFNGAARNILVKNDWTLAFPYPVIRWTPDRLHPDAYSVVFWYNPYVTANQPNAATGDNEDEDDERSGDPFAIFRYDGKYKVFTETTEDVSIDDVLRDANFRHGGVFAGRFYTMHEDYSYTALFDVTRMEIVSDDISINYLPGNLFIMDYHLCLMGPDGYKIICQEVDPNDVWHTANWVNFIGYDEDGPKIFRRINPISGETLDEINGVTTVSSMGDCPAIWIKMDTADDSDYIRYALMDSKDGKLLIKPCNFMPAKAEVIRLRSYKQERTYSTFIMQDGGIPVFDNNGMFKICRPALPKNLGYYVNIKLYLSDDNVTVLYRDMVTDTGYRLITPDGKVANRPYCLGFSSEKYGLLQTTGYKYCNLLSSHTGNLVFSPDEEQYIETHLSFVGIIRNAELEKVLDRYVRNKDESMVVDVANFVFGTVESKYGKRTGPSRIFVYSPISGKKWSAVIDYSGDADAMSKIARLLTYVFHRN